MNESGLLGIAVAIGGASGIGAACCRGLARRGATVAVPYGGLRQTRG